MVLCILYVVVCMYLAQRVIILGKAFLSIDHNLQSFFLSFFKSSQPCFVFKCIHNNTSYSNSIFFGKNHGIWYVLKESNFIYGPKYCTYKHFYCWYIFRFWIQPRFFFYKNVVCATFYLFILSYFCSFKTFRHYLFASSTNCIEFVFNFLLKFQDHFIINSVFLL